VPYLEGGLLPAERTIFFETHLPVLTGGAPIIGMRKGDWKLIMWPSQAALFDMARDPGERVNLAREREPIVEMIGQELLSYLDIQPMTTVQIEPDEAQVEKLRALGYIR